MSSSHKPKLYPLINMAKRKEYKLWKVQYSYRIMPCDSTGYTQKEQYLIVECTKEDAETKADELFAYSDMNKKLLTEGEAEGGGVYINKLRKKIEEYSASLPKPRLTLDSDKEKFSLKPKISSDDTLEYIVTKSAK